MKLTLSGNQIKIFQDREFLIDKEDWTKERMLDWNEYPNYDRRITVGFGWRYIWDDIDIEIVEDMADYLEILSGACYGQEFLKEDYRDSVSGYKSIHKQTAKAKGKQPTGRK
jgi:hypothetical protein